MLFVRCREIRIHAQGYYTSLLSPACLGLRNWRAGRAHGHALWVTLCRFSLRTALLLLFCLDSSIFLRLPACFLVLALILFS